MRVDPGSFGSGDSFAFTDLTFGPIPVTPPPPDFGLVPNFSSAGVNVVAGGAVSDAGIVLRRYTGSTGPISFSASALPPGVSLSIQPNPASGGDFSTVTAAFTANPGAPPQVNFPVTITGTPSATAGTAAHSVTVDLTVTGNFDLRV